MIIRKGSIGWKRAAHKANREIAKAEIRNFRLELETFDDDEICRTPTEIEEKINDIETEILDLVDDIAWAKARVDYLEKRRCALVEQLSGAPRHWHF